MARSLDALDRDFWRAGNFQKTTTWDCREGGPTASSNMSRAAEAAMAASYKSLKEDFVSNLTGGEISEINYVTAVAPVSSETLTLDVANMQTGSSDRLVCFAVAAFILQTLQSSLFRSRFSPQRRSYPPCNDTLCRHASPPQHPPPCPCCTHICRTSSIPAKESEAASIERNET